MAVNKIVTKVDGVVNKTINFNDLKAGLAAGSHTITVEAFNGATLVNSQTRNFTIAGSATYLLDLYPNAVFAFDFYKLNSAYTGACIRVRRADNVEQDIGFSGDALDQSELTTFANGQDCFRVTFYDQSGNGRNMTQTSASNQPKIVSAGVILKEGTKIVEQSDGVNDFSEIPALDSTTLNFTLFTINKLRTTGSDAIILEYSINTNNGTGRFSIVRNSTGLIDITNRVNNGYSIKNTPEQMDVFSLYTFVINRDIADGEVIRKNGINKTLTTSRDDGTTQGVLAQIEPMYADARSGASYGPSPSNKAAMVAYATDQSANLAGIENKINENYNLY